MDNTLTLEQAHRQLTELLKTQSPHTPTDLIEFRARDVETFSPGTRSFVRKILTVKATNS